MGIPCATRCVGAAILAAAAVTISPIGAPSASAEPCPDVQAVFARGTTEPPGLGFTGQAFVDALRAKLPDKNVGEYAVNYPATLDFKQGIQGIADARTHVQTMVANCPDTELVLGGFSQGAAVMGFVTTDLIPDGVTASDVPPPMPQAVADHVAAVALFGKPNERFMNRIGEPTVVIGSLYAPKTVDLCVPEDPICSLGADFAAHNRYAEAGYVDQAAVFAASRVEPSATESESESVPSTVPVPEVEPAPLNESAPLTDETDPVLVTGTGPLPGPVAQPLPPA